MNGVVCVVRHADEKLGIDDGTVTLDEICQSHRIHVMDDDLVVNVVAFDPEIAPVVSSDHEVADLLPLTGSIELLIDPTVGTERRLRDSSTESQVTVPFFDG